MKIKAKLFTFLIIFISCGFCPNYTRAQKIDSSSPPPPPPLPRAAASKNKKAIVSETINYIFSLQIDINSNLSLSIQDTENSKAIGNTADTKILTDFFNVLNNSGKKNSNATAKKINPLIIVKADPNLNFGSTVDFLKKIRKSSGNKIKLETSKGFYDSFALIPEESKNNSYVNVKPNPLALIVQITPDRKITLNNRYESTASDFSLLKKTLTEIFRAREDSGVFREGTNEVERTVVVKAPRSLQLYDVNKVVDAVKEAGASPVVLQIDDLQP
jgi:biopolymer transport protein ExbD